MGHVTIPIEKLYLNKGKSFEKWFYLLNANFDAQIKLQFTAVNFDSKLGSGKIKELREAYEKELENERNQRLETKKQSSEIPTLMKGFQEDLKEIEKLNQEGKYKEALEFGEKKLKHLTEIYEKRQDTLIDTITDFFEFGIEVLADRDLDFRHKVEKILVLVIGKYYFELGNIYEKLGEREKAIEFWKKAEKEYQNDSSTDKLNEIEEEITGFKYEMANRVRYHLPKKYTEVKYDPKISSRTSVLISMFFSWVSYESDARYLSGREFNEKSGYKRLEGLGSWRISTILTKDRGNVSFYAVFAVNEETGVVSLSYRGTELDKLEKWDTIKSWIMDFDILKTNYRYSKGKVHRGFRDLYLSMSDAVERQCTLYLEAGYTLLITGHSAGGAQAVLSALHLTSVFKKKFKDQIWIYTFGCPRIGDKKFVADFNTKFPFTPRYVTQIDHYTDIVPTVPPFELGFDHCGVEHIVVGDKKDIGNPDPIPGIHYKFDGHLYELAKDTIPVGCHFQEVYMNGLLIDQTLGRLYRRRKSSIFEKIFPSSPMSLSTVELEEVIEGGK
jgi:tetratricopeptide (TPR) repeat protein